MGNANDSQSSDHESSARVRNLERQVEIQRQAILLLALSVRQLREILIAWADAGVGRR
jgi:hypothetical protein